MGRGEGRECQRRRLRCSPDMQRRIADVACTSEWPSTEESDCIRRLGMHQTCMAIATGSPTPSCEVTPIHAPLRSGPIQNIQYESKYL
eukprot:1983250-Pleurochrysis_carterae.AAC.1